MTRGKKGEKLFFVEDEQEETHDYKLKNPGLGDCFSVGIDNCPFWSFVIVIDTLKL